MAWVTHLLLFLLPFAAYGLWRRLSPDAQPSRILLILMATGIALSAGVAAWYGLNRRLDDAPYHPAQIRDGRIVPGTAR